MPRSRATARSERLAPSAARWRRAVALISSIISARTRARSDGALIARSCHIRERHADTRAVLLTGRPGSWSISLVREHCSRFRQGRTITMALHIIVGAGATGRETARLLAERGEHVRIV